MEGYGIAPWGSNTWIVRGWPRRVIVHIFVLFSEIAGRVDRLICRNSGDNLLVQKRFVCSEEKLAQPVIFKILAGNSAIYFI